MKDDLIKKIKDTVLKGTDLEESDVRSMMILIRKSLDMLSQADQSSYLITRLFCNWAVHTEITQSNTGLRILAQINNTLVSVKDSGDMAAIQTKISQSIGFPALRKELKSFYPFFNIDDNLVSDNYIWAIFITHLIEIIRDVPLAFPSLSKLDATKQKIYNEISQNSIKPGAGVVAINISRVNYAELGAPEMSNVMCLLIRTEDTTTTVIPLLIDVRI